MKGQQKIQDDRDLKTDVRLEFSDDPDSAVRGSTGYTPWDYSLFVYTYKINALEIK